MKARPIQLLSITVAGLCVGWLVGLSFSPIVQTVVSAVIGVLVAGVGVLAGISSSQHEGIEGKTSLVSAVEINLTPLALMMIGLAIGATVGVIARTNDWLGDRRHTLGSARQAEQGRLGGLNAAVSADECSVLERAMRLRTLQTEMASSPNSLIRDFSTRTTDEIILAAAVKDLICSSTHN